MNWRYDRRGWWWRDVNGWGQVEIRPARVPRWAGRCATYLDLVAGWLRSGADRLRWWAHEELEA